VSLERRISALEARHAAPSGACNCRVLIVDHPAGAPPPPLPPRAHAGGCGRPRRLLAVRPEGRP
jgi:hypothetical protein